MPNFICKVLTPQGQIVKIKMTEEDKITCLKKLKKNGMTPISVESSTEFSKTKKTKISANIYSKRKKKINIDLKKQLKFSDNITTEDLIKFTQDFLVLKKSKFTNKHALMTLVNTTNNQKFKDILHKMINNIDEGRYMYKTMKEYPDIFPYIYRNIIKTGELNDLLEESLEHAITFLKDEESLKSNLEKKIIPYIAMFFANLVMIFLSVLIGMPLIEDIFASNGSVIEIPLGIKILSFGMDFIIKYWYITIFALGLIIFGIVGYINTPKGKNKFDNFKYNNFLLGKLLYLLDFSRFIRCLNINIKNKIRFQDALEVSKNVIDNTHMIGTIENSINNVYVGKSWVTPFEKDKILNPIMLEILKKSERSDVEETLEKVIEYVDVEIEKETKRVMKLLPKISYTVIGILLVLFLVIILIPCLQVYLGGFLFV